MVSPLTASNVKTIFQKCPKYTKIKTFVETGTLYGETIQQVLGLFREIHTIEAMPEFYERCVKKFSHTNVNFHLGKSSEVLPRVIAEIHEPIFFWLDAHWFFQKESVYAEEKMPIFEELKAIQSRPYADLIVIDDAREMGLAQSRLDWTKFTVPAILEKVNRRNHFVWNDFLIIEKPAEIPMM